MNPRKRQSKRRGRAKAAPVAGQETEGPPQEVPGEEVSGVVDPGMDAPPVAEPLADQAADVKEAAVAGPEEVARQLEVRLDEIQDRHLRMVAEYDNFRKRTAKERSEMWQRAQADVVSNILDALDDFGRVLDVDPETASAGDVIKGVELVERKLLRELETAGLERVGQAGEAFDPNHHEAVGSLPAESEELDHTVGRILQIGYRYGGTLIRPARVQVAMWSGDGGEGPA